VSWVKIWLPAPVSPPPTVPYRTLIAPADSTAPTLSPGADRQVLGTVVVEVGLKLRGRGAMTSHRTVSNGRAGWRGDARQQDD
jgi:hypothetical protein